MIARVWHGWTTPAQADAYEALLQAEVFPGILAKRIAGFQRIDLFRRDLGAEVEFMTLMWFTSRDALTDFVGEDQEAAYVPPRARALLARFDGRAAHYEVRDRRDAADRQA